MTHPVGVLNSVLDTIGETPIVELSRFAHDLEGSIIVKLDYFNPGFSKKDRVALNMIEEAEAEGLLHQGQPVVELTSGNAGTGFAIVCAIKGHPFVAVMSKGNSPERARMMRAFGAEVVLVDQLPESIPGKVSGADLDLVEQETQRVVEERGAFRPDQFNLRSNFRAHYNGTGQEFIRQAQPDPPIQGAGYSRVELANAPREYIDGFLTVSGEDATDATRRLAREESIFAGYSSGANVAAAAQLLRGPCRGQTVATIINDSGMKYLSTDLWD